MKKKLKKYMSILNPFFYLLYRICIKFSSPDRKCSRYTSNYISSPNMTLKKIIQYFKESET